MTIRNGSAGSRKRAGERLAARLVPDVRLHAERVGRRAGHDNLERARVIGIGRPLGPEERDLAVQLDRDPAAHRHDHRLAVHRREAVLEVVDEIAGDESDPVLGADDCLELGPLALEPLLALDLLALGRLLEVWVDLGGAPISRSSSFASRPS